MNEGLTPEKLREMADQMEKGEAVDLKDAAAAKLHDATVTVDGVTVTVDSRMLDDVEMLWAMQRISNMNADEPDGNDVMYVLDVIQRLVGEEGCKAVAARLREENEGYAPAGEYLAFLMRIFGELRELKN